VARTWPATSDSGLPRPAVSGVGHPVTQGCRCSGDPIGARIAQRNIPASVCAMITSATLVLMSEVLMIRSPTARRLRLSLGQAKGKRAQLPGCH
jgi:hypothetical protein